MELDKEYMLLDKISKNESLSQRELSSLLGISLGSVNMLINKMIKEGLIKAKSIPAKRVVYMLTPAGIIEKSEKTYKYITYHYNYINNTKLKIKGYLETKVQEHKKIYVVMDDSELSQIVGIAINESLVNSNINMVYSNKVMLPDNSFIVVLQKEDRSIYKGHYIECLIEVL